MNTQPPVEDISAIVSRFQAWTGAQAPTRTKDGVRELSYDEAIRSTRVKANLNKLAPEVDGPVAANDRRRKTKKSASSKKRIAVSRHRKSIQPEEEKASSAVVRGLVPEPAFREVLAEKVSIIPAAISKEIAVIERRTTALSLRISSAEHALLKMRAEEANLSVSCYLRNCVLEVENLRAQLAQKIAEQQPAPMQLPYRLSPFATCIRKIRWLVFGKTTALAVRA